MKLRKLGKLLNWGKLRKIVKNCISSCRGSGHGFFLRQYEFKIGWNWYKLSKIGVNWRKLKLPIFAICINFRQFLQFASIFANFFRGSICHYLFNRNFAQISPIFNQFLSVFFQFFKDETHGQRVLGGAASGAVFRNTAGILHAPSMPSFS